MPKRFVSIRRILLALSVIAIALVAVLREKRVNTPPAYDPGDAQHINFLAIADWGMGNDSQRAVAGAMKRHVEKSPAHYQGVLCGGDNIYVPLSGVDDPAWQGIFEQMYDVATINFPFYLAPGNHDYQNGKLAIEMDYSRQHPESRWKMPAPYYRVDFPPGAEKRLVTVLMLDSDKDEMGEQAWNDELKWMEAELTKPRSATWLIAVAHHPIFSNGDHGDNGVMQNTWGELFRDHGVNLFVCGHDHDMQHLEVDGWQMSFILVGGGGAQVRDMRVDRRGPFSKSMYGFAELNFTPDLLTVKFINVNGDVVHSLQRTIDGSVKVLQTTPSDPAIPRTPGSINRS